MSLNVLRRLCLFSSEAVRVGRQKRSVITSRSSSSTTSVNGLHCRSAGSGDHALLCIPGALGSTDTDFGPQLEHFGRDGSGYTVVSFDPRGYGRSRPPDKSFQTHPELFLRSDARDAYEVMSALGHERFSVLGWSDGGVAGIFLAATRPDAVRNLVVWGTNAFVSDEDIECFKRIENVDNWSKKMLDPLTNVYGSLQNVQAMWSAWVASMVEIHKGGGDMCKEELSRIRCPTLIIHGEKDALLPAEHVDCLQGHIGNVKRIDFPEGKHNVHLRFAEEFNSKVHDFLQFHSCS